ncbi:leukocyte cell-derived chemotaxin-2 [Sphaeramia orbicularis]|uniref:leukocyte cell-derived chemotaxin-2 n=1 Tax=Sphaeramia orbicularis TaxID=375764 RepID=UPI00117FD034|nr:leukocyte cell-derived chemotaxin-2-like [Sphaeramia orbicularis]
MDEVERASLLCVSTRCACCCCCTTSDVLLTWSLEHEQSKSEQRRRPGKKRDSTTKATQNNTAAAAVDDRRPKAVTPKKKLKEAGSRGVSRGSGGDVSCTRLGGICQLSRYICQGRYLEDKCSGAKTLQCCLPVGAWSILCAGHHNNRVRACDVYGCGAFNSRRGNKLHKAVDVVCDDYGLVNAPFSGSLAGPVTHMDPTGIQYDGVKLLSDVHCVQIFNIRPYRYMGPVTKGEALGYLLPLQDRLSGITSHLKLQMCDGTDPSPFI